MEPIPKTTKIQKSTEPLGFQSPCPETELLASRGIAPCLLVTESLRRTDFLQKDGRTRSVAVLNEPEKLQL